MLNYSLIPCILLLIGLLRKSLGVNSDSRPRKLGSGLLNSRNIVISAGAAAAAVGFKSYIDGPVFKEQVDLTGYNVVITGANTGLGKASALRLAQLGALVIMLVKSLDKGNAAIEDIRKVVPNARISAIELDLASLNSIEKCASQVTSLLSGDGIDVLLNNAGVMAIPTKILTKDGFEAHMGINHLGHFALTSSLFPLLKKGGKGKGARVINVSSSAHMLGHIDFENLMFEKEGTYSAWPAYGNSKLANILFTRELNRRLREKSSDIITTACHPGACRTELGRYIFDPSSTPAYLAPVLGVALSPLGEIYSFFTAYFLCLCEYVVYLTKSAEQGAQTQIFLSASKQISLSDSGELDLH